MIVYQVCYEALFDDDRNRVAMEQKHNITIHKITKFHVELCKREGRPYRGNDIYMFMGDWPNLVKYFLYDYYLEDIEQLKELLESIKPIEI